MCTHVCKKARDSSHCDTQLQWLHVSYGSKKSLPRDFVLRSVSVLSGLETLVIS